MKKILRCVCSLRRSLCVFCFNGVFDLEADIKTDIFSSLISLLSV